MFKTSANYLSMIKFSHTIFALPFAIVGFFLAVHVEGYSFEWTKLGFVVLCMVFARSSAMGFNRYIDREIDKKNARTAQREIPAGKISQTAALTFVIVSAIAFVITTWFINPINPMCFFLSPVALLVVLGYSITKRFTALCHFVLGLGLSLAPIGAYLAVTGHFAVLPIIFSFVVLLWTGGFDIIYALQDEDFDKEQNLHSIPAKTGRITAMTISNIAHSFAAILVIIAGVYGSFDWLYWVGAMLFISLLFYQHRLVKPNDISKVDLAFMTTNGVASVLFGVFVVLSLIF
jgi:4-hydroxybenzoate polyprenyltransferase